MSFNEFMHPRNPYRIRPDFKELAQNFPDFKHFVTYSNSGKCQVNFKDPESLRALTKVLLKKDFNLEIEIPSNSLIPTVPQRMNYILWVEDLLSLFPELNSVVEGIDIGTGPCCIFPLLGHKKNGWKFIATEIDEESVSVAEQNVQRNNMQDSITIRKVSKHGSMLKEIVENNDKVYDFCLCNPPFFENSEDQRKQKLPHEPKTLEIITEGGEVSFVKKIIEESLIFKEKIRIYTSMLGKKKSVDALLSTLKAIQGIKLSTARFCQGNTMRWGIAWTYIPVEGFEQNTSDENKKKKKKKEKDPLSFMIPNEDTSMEAMVLTIKSLLNEFQITHGGKPHSEKKAVLRIKAKEVTWKGLRRKRREMERQKKQMLELEKDVSPNKSDSQKRKANETDEDITSIKQQKCEEKSAVKSPVIRENELVLDCTIILTKLDNNFLFQMDSNVHRESMYQVFQLFSNKLKKTV